MNFTNKIAVITGAGRGLGLAYATELAKRGAKVVLADAGCDRSGAGSDLTVVQNAVAALKQQGFEAIAHHGDYAQEAACRELIEQTVSHFGSLDILIHNAGWVGYQPVEETEPGFVERALGINLYAPLWLSKYAWPQLKKSRAPRMVLTTSDRAIFAEYAQPGLCAYAAGKMAQIGIMNALAIEGKPEGILINAISPVAKTRMWGVNGKPENLTAESVVPGVMFLASESCQESGVILRASNGQFTACRFNENPGVDYPLDLARINAVSAESVRNQWLKIREY